MTGIADITRKIVERAKKYEYDTIPGDFGVLKTPCPKCGGEVHERYKAFQCVKCDFSLWKILSGRLFEAPEIETLIRERQLGPLQGFRKQDGQAVCRGDQVNAENKAEFDFGQDLRDGNGAPAISAGNSRSANVRSAAATFSNGDALHLRESDGTKSHL